MSGSLPAWKPIAGVLGAFILVVTALTAWTKGTDWIGNTFLATDDEVTFAVDEHRRFTDPQIIELVVNQNVLTKGQAVIVWQGSRDALERNEDRLFQLGRELTVDPSNPVMLKRKRTLKRNISDGEDEVRRTHCAVLTLNGERC